MSEGAGHSSGSVGSAIVNVVVLLGILAVAGAIVAPRFMGHT